jgi:hypothetical protein
MVVGTTRSRRTSSRRDHDSAISAQWLRVLRRKWRCARTLSKYAAHALENRPRDAVLRPESFFSPIVPMRSPLLRGRDGLTVDDGGTRAISFLAISLQLVTCRRIFQLVTCRRIEDQQCYRQMALQEKGEGHDCGHRTIGGDSRARSTAIPLAHAVRSD